MFDTWTLKKRLTLTFSTILLLAATLMAVALVNTTRLREAVHWNTHTYDVLDQSDSMLLNMVNIETGLRGFVAGGDEKFLEPFTAGQKAFGAAFETARTLTSDNALQQGLLDQLMAHHKQFMEVTNGLVTMRRDATAGKVPVDALLHAFSAGKDKVAMGAFRAGIAEFAKEESGLQVARSAAMDAMMSANIYTLMFGGLALFV